MLLLQTSAFLEQRCVLSKLKLGVVVGCQVRVISRVENVGQRLCESQGETDHCCNCWNQTTVVEVNGKYIQSRHGGECATRISLMTLRWLSFAMKWEE